MREFRIGKVEDFSDDERQVCEIDGREVVVFKFRDRFYALDNTCLHMGGPVGEGMIMGKVEAVVNADRCVIGETFSEDKIHLVCPWHGWEYDIETGESAGQPKLKLAKYDVLLKEDTVYVTV